MNSQKKMGRPMSTNPKDTDVKVRLDCKHKDVLNRYMIQEGITRAEAIRRGIMMLEKDIKK